MTRPVLAVMAGWFDGKLGADIHAQLAEFHPHKISSPLTNGGWPNWRWVERYIDKQAPDGPYVALGFSWGATAAARLAERDANCVGLIYVSGTEWRPGKSDVWRTWSATPGVWGIAGNSPSLNTKFAAKWSFRGWHQLPVLCLCTDGEKRKLVRGTWQTGRNLSEALANVTCPAPAPNPGTHKWPHLAGVAHHLPAIRAFMDKHFGKETQHGRRVQRE